ncbi:MAG: 3',5'-cyclic-nucleotide phosphodiesterase [Burkholderiales bacterium]|nr:3',5'-cyclic-nucleotide phosphodiesterase [Burkholderiales bacterium]
MKVRILGCSGGIGGALRTTSFLLDDDVLIDAGTGVGNLTLEEMCRIDHIFVTHSHLDHIASIPLLVDSVGYLRNKPITVHAIAETLEALQKHIFNAVIWPDFARIPSPESPYLRYETIAMGNTVDLAGRKITPLPANHTVPAVGYHLDSGAGSLVFSGDTTTNDALWEAANRIANLKYLIVETAFSNSELDVAILSKHLCPSLLGEELRKFKGGVPVYITHLKPGEMGLIMQEVERDAAMMKPEMLRNDQVFEF